MLASPESAADYVKLSTKEFDANKNEIKRLLSNKNASHIRLLNDTSKCQQQKYFKALRNLTQAHLKELKATW